MTTNDTNCERCGAPRPAQGACPSCLLARGLQPSSSPGSGANVWAPEPEEIQRHFPQLDVEALLGRGGSGAVYRARQPDLDRVVALKVLAPRVAEDPRFCERFQREARLLARLDHEGIVRVHEFGESDGLYYLLLEHVEGASLRELLEDGKLTPHESLDLTQQLCAALQAAHEAGLVHRDVKPENVLVDADGRARLTDFGIARLLGKPDEERLTHTGQALGTPHYMAPEQLRGHRDVDQRADLYALGVVLYEMLTGELPLGRFVPPSEAVGLGPLVDQLVQKALERNRDQRFQQASDLAVSAKNAARETSGQHVATPSFFSREAREQRMASFHRWVRTVSPHALRGTTWAFAACLGLTCVALIAGQIVGAWSQWLEPGERHVEGIVSELTSNSEAVSSALVMVLWASTFLPLTQALIWAHRKARENERARTWPKPVWWKRDWVLAMLLSLGTLGAFVALTAWIALVIVSAREQHGLFAALLAVLVGVVVCCGVASLLISARRRAE